MKVFKAVFNVLPLWCVKFLRPLLIKVIDETTVDHRIYQKYIRYLMQNYDKEVKRILKKKRVMQIGWECLPFATFGVQYINVAVAFVVYALYKGYIPVIKHGNSELLQWEWFFQQPIFSIDDPAIGGAVWCQCDRTTPVFSKSLNLITDGSKEDREMWSFLYKKFVRLNSDTQAYISEEVNSLKIDDTVLGVLLRGTDYVKVKPKGHPVQPDDQEIVDKIEEIMATGKYSKIYVTTEEKRLFDLVANINLNWVVLENKRHYFDANYYESGARWIAEVHFEENDYREKGLEYLSSLFLLMECGGLVAGNCGGTGFVLDYRSKDENAFIFQKGLY